MCALIEKAYILYTRLLAGKCTSTHQHRLDAISCVNELSFISTSVHFSIIFLSGKRWIRTNKHLCEIGEERGGECE